jgi:diguanylate cyclase (GGDEF)-like protein
MIEQLAERQQKLENEINLSQKHANALEQSNLLLSNITHYIPQQIFVIAADKHEILLFNDLAKKEIFREPDYIHMVMELLPEHKGISGSYYNEINLNTDSTNSEERYLAVNSYSIQWNDISAIALVINDISTEKKQRKELEDYAYRDSLTHTYNRFYGMFTLNDWVDEKRRFTLVFADLDSLKYVNDEHGHSEGDEYIIRVANHLGTVSPAVVVCRIGGDEFMLIIPDVGFSEAQDYMARISEEIENDEHLEGKDFRYSISYGIVAVDENNDLPPSSILSIADEKMYEYKRARKKERRDQMEQ